MFSNNAYSIFLRFHFVFPETHEAHFASEDEFRKVDMQELYAQDAHSISSSSEVNCSDDSYDFSVPFAMWLLDMYYDHMPSLETISKRNILANIQHAADVEFLPLPKNIRAQLIELYSNEYCNYCALIAKRY